jgi:hypothetical protein
MKRFPGKENIGRESKLLTLNLAAENLIGFLVSVI